jgi:biofilm PGA synthesis protein PgaA
MAEFRLDVEATPGASSSVNGGNGIAVEAQIFSSPIDYNWRVFGGGYVAHEELPEGEGNVTLRQSALGVAYSGPDLEASVAGTLTAYGPDSGDTLGSAVDEGRGGLRAEATWSVDDYLQIGGGAEIFSRDTPLRAIGNGITANSLALQATYRESELMALRTGAKAMDFSDGNRRISLDTAYTHRLITRPQVTLDGILGLAASANSADANRPYFNPDRDGLVTAAASMQQNLYRRYEFIWDHRLVLTPGLYWQQGYGTSPVASVSYEQRLRIDDVFDASLGLGLGRQSYDGSYENAIAIMFRLTQRF